MKAATSPAVAWFAERQSPVRPDRGRSPGPSWRERIAWPVGALILASLCYGFALTEYPAFFYHDDVEHELLPLIRAVGGDLGLFDWPSVTLRSWSAGYLSAELVLGHFNPLNRLLYVWMAGCEDLRRAAAVFALVHLALLGLGTHLLARAYGASPAAAAVAGFTMATNNLIVYWYASSWWNILASIAWLPYVLYARLQARSNSLRLIGVACASYLLVTAGAIHAVIAAAVFLMLEDVRCYRRDRILRDAIVGTAGLAIGLALAAHSWLPLLDYLPQTSRGSIHEAPDALSALFGDLLQFSHPFFRPGFFAFTRFTHVAIPIYFIAWFSMTLLVLASAQRWRELWKNEWTLVVAAIFFFLASQGPSMLGPTRFAFRFMPFWMLAITLIVAILGSAKIEPSPGSLRHQVIAALLALYAILVNWQRGSAGNAILSGIWLVAVLALIFLRSPTPSQRWGFCVIVAALFCAQTFVGWPRNGDVTSWNTYESASRYPKATPASAADYTMFIVPGAWSPSPRFYDELSTGNTGLNSGRNLVFGYSPTGHRLLDEPFCLFFFGWACDRSLVRVTRRDVETGSPLYDLMRIRELVTTPAVAGKYGSLLPGSDWVQERVTPLSVRWLRRGAAGYPGSVSYASNRTILRAQGNLQAEHEVVEVAHEGAGAPIVFGRLYLEGYRITLDGKTLPTYAHHDLLLAVRLPADAHGRLELGFIEPTHGLCVAVTLAGLLALVGMVVWMRTRQFVPRPPHVS